MGRSNRARPYIDLLITFNRFTVTLDRPVAPLHRHPRTDRRLVLAETPGEKDRGPATDEASARASQSVSSPGSRPRIDAANFPASSIASPTSLYRLGVLWTGT